MTPFISSVKVVKKSDEGRSGLISVCVLSALLLFFILFNSWVDKQVRAKQAEKEALTEQTDTFRRLK
jgi:hypothetical protein